MRGINIAIILFMTIAAVFSVGFVTASEESESEMCVPTGNLVLNPPDSVQQERSSVDFPHARHFDYSCKECHHKWENEEQIMGCMTSGCHDQTTYSKKPLRKGSYTDASMKYYKYAYHNKCRTCHVEIKNKNTSAAMSYEEIDNLPATGPTGCSGCHPE